MVPDENRLKLDVQLFHGKWVPQLTVVPVVKADWYLRRAAQYFKLSGLALATGYENTEC
jgi:hypothetical protein